MSTLLQFNQAIQYHPGRKKKNNEDYVTFFIPEKETELKASGGLFVLADGVGGAAYGEIASKYAADTVLFEYFQNADQEIGERLVKAFLKANQDINTYAEESGHYTKMATTLVAAAIHENRLILANVGDSRAYLLRGEKIKQLTRDHSVVAEMVRNGEMSEEEAQISSIRNRLSRSIGGQREVAVDLFPPIPLEMGDRILLCSDGLSRYATAENLLGMAGSGKPEEVTGRLVRFANQQGGVDNISVALIEMVEKAVHAQAIPGAYAKPPKIEEWQTAETVFTSKAKRAKGKKLSKKEILIGGILILAVVSLVTSILLRSPGKPEPNPTPTVEAVSIGGQETNVTTIQPQPTMPPGTQEMQSTVEVQPQKECLYKVKPGDNAGIIFEKFSLKPQVLLDYYAEGDCTVGNEIICGNPQPNTNLNEIISGQFLILFQIENEDSRLSCEQNEGIIHTKKED